jgi:hypothetical protein
MNENYNNWFVPNVGNEIYWELKEACKLIAGYIPFSNDRDFLNIELRAVNARQEVNKQELYFDFRINEVMEVRQLSNVRESKGNSILNPEEFKYVHAIDFVEWAISKEFKIPDAITKGLALNTIKIKSNIKNNSPMWLQDPRDPIPNQPWYTPARYFARQLVAKNASLKTKRNLLAQKVQKLLTENQVFKRGGKLKLQSSTIEKAFIKIILD